MNTPRDNNHVPAKFGVLFSDPTVLVPIAINPANDCMMTNSTDTIGFDPTGINFRDENYVNVMMGVNDSTGEAFPVIVDATGAVLIEQ